jgi:putative transposase
LTDTFCTRFNLLPHSLFLALEQAFAQKGLTMEVLQAGSRNREYSAIRRELAGKFVIEMGMSHADVARMLGISRAGVSMLVRR